MIFMYAIHTTPGFIVGSRASGEAGKILSIFTRDLGLIRVIAMGIRLEKSKLRPFVQDYSFGIFSLVRGKEYWRLTSAQEVMTLSGSEFVARIAVLLHRLLQGEEAHPELFETINSLSRFLRIYRNIDDETSKNLESLIVMRILHRLGYIALTSNVRLYVYIEADSLDLNTISSMSDMRKIMNQHINKALRESHL